MDETNRKMAKVLASAWLDPAAMRRLKDDPRKVLAEAGLEVKGDLKVHALSGEGPYVLIPPRPAGLSDEDLREGKVHPDLCSVIFCLHS